MSQVGEGGGRGEGEDRGSLLLLCVTETVQPPSLHLLSSDRWSDAAVLLVLRIYIYPYFQRSITSNNFLAHIRLLC